MVAMSGKVAELVAKREVELIAHQISEILAVKGVTLVGSLPGELQNATIYSTGIAASKTAPDAAKALIEFLTSPPAREKFRKVGLDYKG